MRTKPITKEEEVKIDQIRKSWISKQTDQHDDEKIIQTVGEMWAVLELPAPKVLIVDSPKAGLEHLPEKISRYSSYYWCGWASWNESAKMLGVDIDEEKYNLFEAWCKHCVFVFPYDELCVVSRNPTEIHWLNGTKYPEGDVVHREDGKAIVYRDGWGVWVLNGLRVDEQLVMHPETQTIEQIDNEDNADLRAVRIERYGPLRYLEAKDAKVIHKVKNEIEGTIETLLKVDDERWLWATCPSGRNAPPMPVPGNINTCEGARLWLGSGRKIIART